ncbi:hypothetical protein EG329_001505 [Mollisiaceae sp. DMI_Dod_QoI]|nr:hypothetical protein EG329_001505 [Helotiales sp. DMI_Dod_QoI]
MAKKFNNQKGKGGAGAHQNGNKGGKNGGMKYCTICKENKTHVTADCYKLKNKQNTKNGQSQTNTPSRPCSHCGGAHYNNQCPNNQNGISHTQGKPPSRPCSHCQGQHYDNQCPSNNGGQKHGNKNASNWQNQNQPFNQPCPSCGQAHQGSQCPNCPQQPTNQYLATTNEVQAQIGQLVAALQSHPLEVDNIFGQWRAAYPNFSLQQQEQVPAINMQPLVTWQDHHDNFQRAQPYEETCMAGRSYVPAPVLNTMQYGEFGVVPDSIDRDGDVVMSEWDYVG